MEEVALGFYVASFFLATAGYRWSEPVKAVSIFLCALGFLALLLPAFFFALIFQVWAGLLLVVTAYEYFKLKKLGLWRWKTFARSLQYYALTSVVGMAFFLALEHWGGSRSLPDQTTINIILQTVLILFILDLKNYIFHRLQHRFDYWWRFHEIHHAPRDLISLSVAQAHILDWLVTSHMANVFILWVLGFSFETMILYQYFILTVKVFTHTPFETPVMLRWLRLLVVTPEFHRWHHDRGSGQRKNYGELFTIWDRFFGTYVSPQWAHDIGIESVQVNEMSIWEQQLHPFRKSR